jgi:hypothetical protein
MVARGAPKLKRESLQSMGFQNLTRNSYPHIWTPPVSKSVSEFLEVRIGLHKYIQPVNAFVLAHSAEGFPAPVPEFGDSFRDELRCRLALARARFFHVLILEVPDIFHLQDSGG